MVSLFVVTCEATRLWGYFFSSTIPKTAYGVALRLVGLPFKRSKYSTHGEAVNIRHRRRAFASDSFLTILDQEWLPNARSTSGRRPDCGGSAHILLPSGGQVDIVLAIDATVAPAKRDYRPKFAEAAARDTFNKIKK